ncbi:MAG: OmpH family outer membrane protein, partial [Dysgonamonadaceae bacterium]|nr:OmpH family outer membrane protein [Dysgonamonadaceae bacterium]
MLKKILLITLLALPFGIFAQDKLAYFNSLEVILNMPEYTQMQDSLKRTQEAIKADLATMEEEYSRKYEAFMKESENLIETIKIRRLQEIRDLEQRAGNYNEQSQQML